MNTIQHGPGPPRLPLGKGPELQLSITASSPAATMNVGWADGSLEG
ncbi:hypothetical protein [Streptomyces sp. NPDC001450]